jgi:AAA domain
MAWRESPAPKESEISPRGNPLRESVRGAFGISYAIEPFVRSGSLYSLTAKTGAGKTALLINMALAVATGRGTDIIGREVTRGRVAYVAVENPDDLRMRLMVAAFVLNIDLNELAQNFVILDQRVKPEALVAKLKALSAGEAFTLIMVDTLAAYYDGDDINNNVQAGDFMRRLRPMTRLLGLPSVVVAAHPVKNAPNDNLIPYGGGAILNEVDGNLTLSRSTGGVTELHWQGKLRGVEFEPTLFRFDTADSPDVLDVKGRRVQLPVLYPTTAEEGERREQAAGDRKAALLKAMAQQPNGSIRDWAAAVGTGKSAVGRNLQALAKAKLAESTLGKWTVTDAGRKAIRARGDAE